MLDPIGTRTPIRRSSSPYRLRYPGFLYYVPENINKKTLKCSHLLEILTLLCTLYLKVKISLLQAIEAHRVVRG
jgi:hypothetical protein